METKKNLYNPINLKKNKAKAIMLSGFKLYHKAIENSKIHQPWAGKLSKSQTLHIYSPVLHIHKYHSNKRSKGQYDIKRNKKNRVPIYRKSFIDHA